MKSGVSTNTKASKFQYEPLQNKTKQLHCNKTNIIFTKKKCAELHIKADSHKQQELYCSYNFFFNVGQQPIDKTSIPCYGTVLGVGMTRYAYDTIF